jgi:YbbR domain-containing protein
VTVIVEPDVTERVFPRVSVDVRGTELVATAQAVNVTVRGPPAVLAELDPEQVTSFVEMDDERSEPGTFRMPVQVEGLAEGLEVTLDPSAVVVTLVRAAPPAPSTEGDGGP